MSSEGCLVCDGFGWVPAGDSGGWYRRDWRLLLDATVSWQACPACGDQRPALVRLHEKLANALLQRLDEQGGDWRIQGPWRHGLSPEGQEIWRWQDLACLPPGPLAGHDGWMLVSPLGLSRHLDCVACAGLLAEAGAPELP